jgi:hypothetical protein
MSDQSRSDVERVVRYTMPYSLIVCGFYRGIPVEIQMRIHLNKQGFEFEDDNKTSSAINKNPIPVGVLEWSDNEFGRTFVQRIPCT